MGVIYSPLLLITAWMESKEAHEIKRNQNRGRWDDDTTEDWEQMQDEFDPDNEGWAEKVEATKPNVETDAAVLEVRELKDQVKKLMKLVEGMKGPSGPS